MKKALGGYGGAFSVSGMYLSGGGSISTNGDVTVEWGGELDPGGVSLQITEVRWIGNIHNK